MMPPRALLGALLVLTCCELRAAAAGATAPAKPAPDARFGDVLYRTPDASRWKMREAGGRRIFSASLPPPDFCTLTIFTDAKLEGDFATAFDRAVTASLRDLRSEKIESDSGPQAGKAAEGFDVLQRMLVCEAPDFHTCHWFLAGNPGDRFDLIAFQTSSEEMYRTYGQDAADFFYSVKLASSLAPGSEALAATSGTVDATPADRADVARAANNAPAKAFGPLAVGDRVEVPWAGGWTPGVVMHVEGLTYFVHYGSEEDAGKYDDFFTLNLIRPPGGPKTYAETFRGTTPDPEGGPVAIGADVEFLNYKWEPARIARKLGDRYVIFSDKPGDVTEQWLSPDKLRLAGTTATLAATPPPRQPQPATIADVHIGDLVEAKPGRGFWTQLTVLARAGDSYFVKIGPNSGMSMRGWVGSSHMRAVGAKQPFEAEDLSFFVGRWSLGGDSFQVLVGRTVSGDTVTETHQNNSGAGLNFGMLVVNADGTYELRNTTVYHDGKGRWERNPNQDEGGIVLRGADGKGDEDCIVTNHQDGFGYFQGAIRGPGKWCTRLP